MFDEILQETFDEREKRILQFWEERAIFQQSIEEKKDAERFVFYDGPPFATGLPHYGHLLAGTIKDVVPRYKTMKGYYAPRRFGWDCHGLPVENEIQKTFNLSEARSIEDFGIGRFNEECRKIVLRYTEEWKSTVLRMGRWVDFNQTYRTMDKTFMESVWWVFKELFNRGFVYEGYKVMPFSAKLGTPLSNFEAGENYKEVDDPSLTVLFPIEGEKEGYFVAWTTTPWTLVSNLALMVHPEREYVKVQVPGDERLFILAKERVSLYFPDATVVATYLGKELEGKKYHPLFDYFKGAFRVIMEPSVAIDEGTGIVHAAPAFGEVDFYACQREGIDPVCPVDNNGLFLSPIDEYKGQFVKDADKDIIRRLKEKHRVLKHETCHHRYPFCWRSDTPLIYKAVTTWFVAVEKIKGGLLESNKEIHWTPGYIKEGRFGKWLEGARDWAISRNRYWGTPIPLWRAEDGEVICIGSVQELEELIGQKIDDIHRHFIDDLTFQKNGKIYKRIPEVFDCWFESGSMPYAQDHYPFENRDLFEKNFPADFIAEGLDQTRCWFYVLTVLSTALFKRPAFKNVIVNGIILAEDGAKMSKRLRNYPDPVEVIHKYGADAIRLYMLDSPAAKASDLRFSEKGVELVLRQVLIPFWNAYSFFVTYARIYKWKPTTMKPATTIDQWILSLLGKLIEEVEAGLDDYDLTRAVKPFVGFIDQLTNWYIRRSRRRFWADEDTVDRQSAFATLYTVLIELSKIAAPFVPFISEAIYQNLKDSSMKESVHLCSYPAIHPEWRVKELEEAMEAVQVVVSLGHALRKEHKVKVRLPLPEVHIACTDSHVLKFLEEQRHLVEEELNVKAAILTTDEKQFVELKPKPNFRILGKKVGSKMPLVQKMVAALPQEYLKKLLKGEEISLDLDGETITLNAEEVQVERHVKEGLIAANEGIFTVALNTTLTEELEIEGLARELINKINTMRREADFAVTDRIHIHIDSTPRLNRCLEAWGKMIQEEVLALQIHIGPNSGQTWDLNGERATLLVTKVT